jgi:flagellar biosynthesis/type III secretory pathway protein FliH
MILNTDWSLEGERRQRGAAWRASGESASLFAAREGYGASSLRESARRQRPRERAASTSVRRERGPRRQRRCGEREARSVNVGAARERPQGEIKGRAEGKAEGLLEGRRGILEKLLQLKFGALSEQARERIAQLDLEGLDTACERVLSATGIEQVLA